MPDVAIRPFSEEHLGPAAELLAERHERHLAAEPLLARDADYRGEVAAALAHGEGAVALVDGEVHGYLIGNVTDADAFVGFAGCAARKPELVRDLYAALSPGWERDRHRAYIPASDAELVDAWARLAFGIQFTLAVRETEPGRAAGVDIRAGSADDLDAVVALEQSFAEHLRATPSYSDRKPQTDDAIRAEWADMWDDERFTQFVAVDGGRVLGHVLLYRRPAGDLRVPAGNIDLALLVVDPSSRRQGIGTALTTHALAYAHEAGYRSMTIDWRVVNLAADRFFTARGFRPTFVRMYRHIP
ncbi:MAG: GNAT family N-acetyltransferase [Gaiellaceae bacterium]